MLTDISADVTKLPDRHERVSLMEPLLLSSDARQRPELLDLALELTAKAAGFRSGLPSGLLVELAGLVRSMNCYYSNLIEGHNTHPVDIERALHNDYSGERHKRDLQMEARAHIEVQAWIDQGGLPGRSATRTEAIREIHRRFCEQLPEDLLWVKDGEDRECVLLVPGQLRRLDVKVGQHVAISPEALPRFLERFEQAYGATTRTEALLSVAAAHHRLLWLHPFLDGNGRVARLISHAQLLDLLQTGAVWSVARGLARNVQLYKEHLTRCDQERRNDLDGRGHLSQDALAEFTRFFLTVCIDQVDFMEGLMQPARFRTRLQHWAEDEMRLGTLPVNSDKVLIAALYEGELPRNRVATVVQTGERQARRIAAALLERGALTSDGPRLPLRLTFPAALAYRWMPGLFPEQTR